MLTRRQIDALSEIITDDELLGKVVSVLSRLAPASIRQARWRAKRSSTVDAKHLPSTSTKASTLGTIGVSSISRESLEKKKDSGCAREREFFDAYNVCAKELGWTIAKKLDQKRRVSIKRCIDEAGGLEQAFDHLNDFANSKHGSGFGAGQNDREWVIGIDYVIRAGKWLEIMEGKFNGVSPERKWANGNGHANGADIFRTSSGKIF